MNRDVCDLEATAVRMTMQENEVHQEAEMSSIDDVARMRRLIQDGFGRGDMTVLDELMSPNVVEHQRGNLPGVEGAKGVVQTLHRWMSDFSLTVEDVAVSGDVVWTRNRARGINTGSVMGSDPTGEVVEIDVVDIARFQDGKVVEHWGVADQFGMMLQLGIVPAREAQPADGPAVAG